MPTSFVDILQSRAEHQPHRDAFTFLHDADDARETVTYADLYGRALGMAAHLADRQPGDRVLLLFPPGIDYVAALLACWMTNTIAVPTSLPGSSRRLGRLDAIQRDADCAVALSSEAVMSKLGAGFAASPRLGSLTVCRVDGQGAARDDGRLRRPAGTDAALLQYTSGSTGDAKGVIVRHDNLLANSRALEQAFAYTPESHCFTWLPPYHDMGLVGGILQPLHGGFPCTAMSPAAFMVRPRRWLEGIARARATLSGGPDFAYELCVRRVDPETVAQLDLRSWTVAFSGAEPVRIDTLERFAHAFRPAGFSRDAFLPCYGLAESTLFATGHAPGRPLVTARVSRDALERHEVAPATTAERSTVFVGCGRATDGDLLIVDPETRRRCPDRVGEIWLASRSCAAGYWRRPDASHDVFEAALADDDGARRYLRTGDLGFVRDGELYVAGRIKELLIVRGRNHFPQAIEDTVARALDLPSDIVLAFTIFDAGEERLAIAIEAAHAQDAAAAPLVARIRERVANEHEVDVWRLLLTEPRSLPRTTSGKKQRGLFRSSYLDGRVPVRELFAVLPGEGDAVGSRDAHLPPDGLDTDAVVERLRTLVAHHARTPRDTVREDVPLSHYGLDSLASAELAGEAARATARAFSPVDFISDRTIRELALERRLAAPERGAAESATPAPVAIEPAGAEPVATGSTGAEPGRVELGGAATGRHTPAPSPGQQALLDASALTHGGHGLNIAQAFLVAGEPDVARVRAALRALYARHDAMRRMRPLHRSSALRDVAADAEPILRESIVEHEDAARQRLADAAWEPFDREREAALRIEIVRAAASGATYLLLVVDHLFADLTSVAILVQDFLRAYETGSLPASVSGAASFADYLSLAGEASNGVVARGAREAWLARLHTPIDATVLPFQRHSVTARTALREAEFVRVRWSREESDRARAMARSAGATLFTLMLAAWGAMLRRCGTGRRLAVAAPMHGRPDARFARTVGYFVNVVPVVLDLREASTWRACLDEARCAMRHAMEWQSTPLAVVAELAASIHGADAVPLSDVMMTLYREGTPGYDVASAIIGESAVGGSPTFSPRPIARHLTQFRLALHVVDWADGLGLACEYDRDAWERAEVDAIAALFTHTVGEMLAAAPDAPIAPAAALPPSHAALIAAVNQTARTYEDPLLLHRLIERQVARVPEHDAVVDATRRVSYAELDRRANRLAAQLRGLGAGPDRLVIVFMERSIELAIALVAVLKAGAAYLPLGTDHPSARLAQMIAEAAPVATLLQPALAGQLPAGREPRIMLGEDWGRDTGSGESVPAAGRCAADPRPDDLAYVIYTSGSTGTPKGAMNTHRAICNRLLWMQERYRLSGEDRVLQKTPVTFDVSVWEFFWPLLSGATLVMAAPGVHRDARELWRLIAAERITTVHFVPSMLQAALDDAPPDAGPALRRIICSGEALPATLQRRCREMLAAELHNLYGPTEAAVDVTAWACTRESGLPVAPIGKPIANVDAHVLDRHGRPCPLGVAGELYLGGIGLARGYQSRPGLTAERFTPHAFADAPGLRLYRTGDLARWRAAGDLEFLGRVDHQVKIRGHRIELGEIEALLTRHPAVAHAAVIVEPDAAGDPALTAFVVIRAGHDAPGAALKASLRGWLPEWMVPAAIIALDALPLGASGKVDRRALGRTGAAARRAADPRRPEARTPAEEMIARIWCDILQVPEVPPDANFFDLGGHSLSAVRVRSRLEARLGVAIPLRVLLDARTVVDTVGCLAAHVAAQDVTGRALGLIAELESHADEAFAPELTLAASFLAADEGETPVTRVSR